MKKLTLDLETLAVESFSAAAAEEEADTVQANAAPTPPYRTCSCTCGQSYLAVFCPPPPQ